MEYNKKVWASKELITKEALNNIEDGIDNLYTKVNEIELEQGPQGEQGPAGPQGEPGYTPVKGVDYFTEEDKTELLNELASVEHDIYYTKEEINEKKLISYYDIYLQDENGDYIIDEDGNYIIEGYASIATVEKLQAEIEELRAIIEELRNK